MTLDELVEFCTDDSRVCPLPRHWHELWKMLPNREPRGAGWEPPLPLILAAWWEASDSLKRARLKVHLEWANSNGVLGEAADFLLALSDEDWHYE
jgi:hypothetical protein